MSLNTTKLVYLYDDVAWSLPLSVLVGAVLATLVFIIWPRSKQKGNVSVDPHMIFEHDKVKQALEDDVKLGQLFTLEKLLYEYETWKHESDVTVDFVLIAEAKQKIEELKRAKARTSAETKALEDIKQATAVNDIKRIDDIINKFEAFRMSEESGINLGSENVTNEDDVEDEEENIEQFHEEIKDQLVSALALKKIVLVENSLHEYEKFISENNGTYGITPDKTLSDKARHFIIGKREHIKEQHDLLRQKLIGAIAKVDDNEIRECLKCYQRFVLRNQYHVAVDNDIVSQASEILVLAAQNGEMYQVLKSGLKAPIEQGELNEINDAVQTFVSMEHSVTTDEGLLHRADHTTAKLLGRVRDEHESLKENLKDAMQSKIATDVCNTLKEYQEFISRNESLIDADKLLLEDAEVLMRALREHETRKTKLIHATDLKSKEGQGTLVAYEDFLIKEDSESIGDFSTDERAKDAIQSMTEEQELRRRESEAIKAKHKALRRFLKHAIKSRDLDQLKESLEQYTHFIETNKDTVDADTALQNKASSLVSTLKRDLKICKRKNKKLKSDLMSAIQTRQQEMLVTTRHHYERFVERYGHFVETDNDLMLHARNMLNELANEAEEIQREYQRLKEKLQDQIKGNCDVAIQECLREYTDFIKVNKGCYDIDLSLVDEAQVAMDVVQLKTQLVEAMESMDLAFLRKAIENVEKSAASRRLEPELKQAQNLLQSLKNLEQLKFAVLNLHRATMMEIREYSHPPKVVHDVMIAVLLILGDPESVTRDWMTCQKLCNSVRTPTYVGLMKRVQQFNFKALNPEIAARALEILDGITVDDVMAVSQGAFIFYSWVVGMCDQCLSMEDHRPKPASGSRQRALLKSSMKLLQK